MREHNFIATLWKSFYDKSLYQDVRAHWGFNTLVYLLLLMLIYVIALFISDYRSLHQFMSVEGKQLAAQVPTGKILNGKMSIDKPSPYTIYLADTDHQNKLEPLVLFDMNDQVHVADTNASIIFYSTGYYYYENTHKPLTNTLKENQRGNKPPLTASFRFQTYPTHQTLTFSPQQAQRWVNEIQLYFPFVAIIFLALVKFIFILCQAILYAF